MYFQFLEQSNNFIEIIKQMEVDDGSKFILARNLKENMNNVVYNV